jgi:peptidoglycan/xylan/chitin deacetylase (PgdA/CDA1 family)
MTAPPNDRTARRGTGLRVLFGAVIAALLLTSFLVAAARAPKVGSALPAPAATPVAAEGLGLVVRTAKHLRTPGDAVPLADRFAADGVRRAWVQVKQDESEEFPAGTLFYPSSIGPVAAGHDDGRLGELITALSARRIEPLAWMPTLHDAQAAAAHPEWRSQRIAEDGSLQVEDEWLCPFHPAVQAYQASIAAEVARTFPQLGGLYLDFIRYDDDYSCACPTCLAELEDRTDWTDRVGRRLTPADIRAAGAAHDELWTSWQALRAEKITETIGTIRRAVHQVRPNLSIGAFVLPFTAREYQENTHSGQDLARMATTGIDRIVLMGYWDDWGRDPAWVRQSLDAATALVAGRTSIGLVLDGDMGVRSTRLTLEALGPWAGSANWFSFDEWTPSELARLTRAVTTFQREGPMSRPGHVSVVIRVDTEPDDELSYQNVDPAMIDTLLELFAAEQVPATFLTVGRLAELQPEAIRRAAAAGHEIGSHSYDHEQLDALPVEAQLEAVDRGLASLRNLGFDVHGFGAPRNSITDEVRDRLMARGLEYDGSAAYDPMTGLLDVRYQRHSAGLDDRIVVVPFVMPNDWDARVVAGLSAPEMALAWTQRLDRVVASGEPVFVLDVHQWSISQPDNREALRRFIRHAKECEQCRVETLRDAARHARTILDRYETASPTGGRG